MMECERTDCLFNIDDKCTRQNKEDMTALEKWKNDFKEFISELSMPRDDYKGILAYIDEVPNEASEQQTCKDWHNVPSDEMTLEQARQAVKDLRKKLAEDLEKNRENLINQKATTCRHGGHCEWVACDKCNHYEPDALSQQPCEDCISRETVKQLYYKDGYIAFRKICNLPPVTPKEKTGRWREDANKIDAQFGRHTYICSECGKYAEYFISGTEVWWDRIKPNYCPNCGSYNRGGDNGNE